MNVYFNIFYQSNLCHIILLIKSIRRILEIPFRSYLFLSAQILILYVLLDVWNANIFAALNVLVHVSLTMKIQMH